MKKSILLVAIFFLANSCKDKKHTEENLNLNPLEETQPLEDDRVFFSFSMDAEFKNDDNISFYYLTPESEKITIKNSLNKNISGSTELQTVLFELPKDILPTRIFFRFGEKGEQKIKIKKVSLTYGKDIINVPDSLFFLYFNPNKNVFYNKEDYSIESVSNTNPNENPMFFSRQVLEEKIDLTFF